MKQHTFAAFAAAILMLALIGPAIAHTDECPCGNWKPKQFGFCKPHEECCRPAGFFFHQHGEHVCPPAPPVVVVPPPKDTMVPYDEWGYLGVPDLMSGSTVVSVPRHDIPYVHLQGFYASEFDTLEMCTNHGEWLSDGFYNSVVVCDRAYGGMPGITLYNPQRTVLLRAAKDSLSDFTLPMRVVLTDDAGITLYEKTTPDRTIETTIILSR